MALNPCEHCKKPEAEVRTIPLDDQPELSLCIICAKKLFDLRWEIHLCRWHLMNAEKELNLWLNNKEKK